MASQDSKESSVDEQAHNQQQSIDLNKDGDGWHAINASNVSIQTSSKAEIENHSAGSNRVRSKIVASQQWDRQFYNGRLVASNFAFMAYSLALAAGKGYAIRVIHVETEARTLLKGMNGSVCDLGFAHQKSNFLACVDQMGSVFIWKLNLQDSSVVATVKLHVVRDPVVHSLHHRLMWCPQMATMDAANYSEEGMDGLSIALISDTTAEIWDVGVVSAAQVREEPVLRHTLRHGLFVVENAHSKTISGLCLAPNGDVLATAGLDGHVKFWQVEVAGSGNEPKCLHDFVPHGGQPISCLFFTDNHLSQDSNAPFWRFLITGCCLNSELKVWCAINWKCIQTINFQPSPEAKSCQPELQVGIDMSASYLILSDVKRAVLYVAHIKQDLVLGVASLDGIMEFLLGQPLLSLSIDEVKEAQQGGDMLIGDKAMESQESQVLIKLLSIHTRCCQELQIRFPVFDGEAVSQEDKTLSRQSSTHLMAPGEFLSSSSTPQPLGSPTAAAPDEENLQSQSVSSFTTMSSVQEENLSTVFPSGPSPLNPIVSMKNSPMNFLKASNPLMKSDLDQQQRPVNDLDSDGDEKDDELDMGLSNKELLLAPLPTFPSAGESLASDVNNFEAIFKQTNGNVGQMEERVDTDTAGDEGDNEASDEEEDLSKLVQVDESLELTATPTLPLKDPLLQNISAEEILNDPKTKAAIAKKTISLPSDSDENVSDENVSVKEELVVSQEAVRHKTLVAGLQSLENSMAVLSQRLSRQEERSEELTSLLMSRMSSLEGSLAAQLDASMAKQGDHSQSTKLEQQMTEKQRHDKLVSSLQQTVGNSLHGRVERAIKAEIKSTIVPAINKIFSPMQDQINKTLAEKLSVADAVFKEEVEKLVSSQVVVESIGRVVGVVVQQTAQTAFRDVMLSTLVPSFEKTCHAMFGQMNELFQHGTTQYLKQVQRENDEQQAAMKKSIDGILVQVQQQAKSMQRLPDTVLKSFSDKAGATLGKHCAESLARINEALAEQVGQIMRDGLIPHLGAVPVIPDVTGRHKDQIKGLLMEMIRKEKLKEAFQQALSAGDLELVVLVCSTVSADKVLYSPNCPLPQPIVLSLIQQLSSDLQDHLELKLNYVQSAILALDRDDPVTKEHIRGVLGSLMDQLMKRQVLIQAQNPALRNTVRMLMLAIESLQR